MKLWMMIRRVLLLLMVVSGVQATQGTIARSFFHQNRGGVESLVFYLSQRCTPQLINEQIVSATRKIRVYRLPNVRCDPVVFATFPYTSALGYSVSMNHRGNSAELSVSYDPRKLMIVVSTFDSIGNQPAIAFHSVPRVLKKKKKSKELGTQLVVIDCGHGGSDSGAIGQAGVQEKQVALAVGRALKQSLQNQGISVLMTRTADSDTALDARTSYANTHGPDLFISLHANHAARDNVSGIETWFLAPRVHRMPGLSDADGACVLHEYLNERACRSGIAARQIHQDLMVAVKQHDRSIVNRGVKQAVSQVLLGVDAPAVLIELGFVSHPKEEQLLNSQLYQKTLVQGICTGIVSVLMRLDSDQK